MEMQHDFGGFDPSFIGVSVNFGSQRAWDFFQRWNAAPDPIPVANLPSNEHFEALSLASVISHEMRHFHDFLLTPYSAHLFRLRMQSFVNLTELMVPVLRGEATGANCLFVPLPTWCRMDSDRREREVNRLPKRPDQQPWKPVEFPRIDFGDKKPLKPGLHRISPETLEMQIRAANQAHERIHDLTFNPAAVRAGNSFQPWEVFEISGILVQLQDVMHTYGLDEAQFFLDSLLGFGSNPYARLIRLCYRLWEKLGRPMDMALTGAMVMWSLLGSYRKDQWNACPTHRFSSLYLHLLQTGFPEDLADAWWLFDHWSTQLGLSTVAEGLDDTLTTFRGVRDLAERLLQGEQDSFVGEAYGDFTVRVSAGVAQASEHMVRTFTEEPERYISPHRYLENPSGYANPVVRYVFNGDGGLEVSTDLERQGYIVQWAVEEAGGQVVQSVLVPYRMSVFSFLEREDVDKLETMIAVTDYLFATRARARPELARAGSLFFAGSAIRPLELLVRA